MCAQRQDEERERVSQEGDKTLQKDSSGDDEDRRRRNQGDEPDDEDQGRADGGHEEATEAERVTEPTVTDGPPQAARDPKGPPMATLERDLDLPAGASREASAMIEAELRRRAAEREEEPRSEAAPVRQMAAPRGGTSRGVISAPGPGTLTHSGKQLRSGQHRTVSRISGRSRPTEESETMRALRAELLRNPGGPGQPRLNPQQLSADRSGRIVNPDPLHNTGAASDPDDTSDDEELNGAQATAVIMARVRSYDEMAYNTARNYRGEARAEILNKLYTPEYKARLGKMDWYQVTARATCGFPTDRPVFEDAFPFQKWTRWTAVDGTAATGAATPGGVTTAPREGEPSIEYHSNPAALRTAGHTPRHGCSPVQDEERFAAALEEEGINTTERATRPEQLGGQMGTDLQLTATDTKGIELLLDGRTVPSRRLGNNHLCCLIA